MPPAPKLRRTTVISALPESIAGTSQPIDPTKLSQGYGDLVPTFAIMMGIHAEDEVLMEDISKANVLSAEILGMTSTVNSHAEGRNKDSEADKTTQTKERHKDTQEKVKGAVEMPKKVYRPPLTSLYREPDLGSDPLDGMDWLFACHGKSLRQLKEPLPPRPEEDIIRYTKNDEEELLNNLDLSKVPNNFKENIIGIVQEYWDVFASAGLRKCIRGFLFEVDTGDCEPICCKTPRYGPHETKIMLELINALDKTRLISDDTGPWGALIVLAAKPGQFNVPWEKFKWRLCVSYRKLNQVTKPFQYPIPRCDDAVEEIPPWNAQSLSSWRSIFLAAPKHEVPAVEWLIAIYHKPKQVVGKYNHQLEQWAWEVLGIAQVIEDKIGTLKCIVLLAPRNIPSTLESVHRKWRTTPTALSWTGWSPRLSVLENTKFGGSIVTEHDMLCILPNDTAQKFSLKPYGCIPGSMKQHLELSENSINFHQHAYLDVRPVDLVYRRTHEHQHSAIAKRLVKAKETNRPTYGYPAYDPEGPAPNISSKDPGEEFFPPFFGVWTEKESGKHRCCRPVHIGEICSMLGLADQQKELVQSLQSPEVIQIIRNLPGRQCIEALLHNVAKAEIESDLDVKPPPRWINDIAIIGPPATHVHTFVQDIDTLPLPTTAQWKALSASDQDIALLLKAIPSRMDPTNAKTKLIDRGYWRPWKQDKLDVEDGLLYHYEEPKRARLKHIRQCVVPKSLRKLVCTSCHASPMAGHSDLSKTYYRIVVRFWWPKLHKDIVRFVKSCAHCRIANNASHEAQMTLRILESDAPFDVMFLDIWSPGDIPDTAGNFKVLTALCCMTGYAIGVPLPKEITSTSLAHLSFMHIFVPFGLPRLVIVDDDSKFKGFFIAMLTNIGMAIDPVSPQNHKAVRNERFHRYLNKVETINTADKSSFTQWLQGVMFAMYAWNASPVDGTNIPRSVAAIGKEIPFPIDIKPNTLPVANDEGQAALDHIEAIFPLIKRQRDLLKVLNEERRARHRELKNKGKSQRDFDPGDLVLVRKQVQSNAAKGTSAKLVFKAKGPYRVIEQLRPGTYKLQKLPFTDNGKPGRIVKESSARMEKIPSTIIVHKRADGPDTRLASLQSPMSPHPLENWLGILKPGTYKAAEPNKDFAFVKIEDMWSDEELEEDDSDQEENDAEPDTPAYKRRHLKEKIASSLNKLFFISYTPTGQVAAQWYLVQVDLDESDTEVTDKFGVYLVKFYIRHHQDSTHKSICSCRYWPEIHKLQSDGEIGSIYPVAPKRVKNLLQARTNLYWYQDDVNLVTDALVGPFNFKKGYLVDAAQWEELQQEASKHGIDTQEINRIVPLR